MKLLSWNVNGLRARMESQVLPLLQEEKPDLLLLQETKAEEHQVPALFLSELGYRSWWHPALRPGYSGVATFSRIAPVSVECGIGVPDIDCEGRVLTLNFANGIAVVNAYFPNSQRGLLRLDHKIYFLDKILRYLQKKREEGYSVVIGGDFNIAHREIDLRNPRQNMENAGFLPEERSWIDRFIAAGFVDTFRIFCPDGGHYTWWSYRPGVRQRNIGWRIDYFFVDASLAGKVSAAGILSHIAGSDHCPVSLEVAPPRAELSSVPSEDPPVASPDED
ncbi:exodeoxyribonuclease III [Geomonas sp. RF6]|uniref:exodeoxyribonuclease III n=1 Tax=Geomonas sp. RF6 TaxID=2897342 RepID=UPI001E2E9EE2|nr:exodeoxyribonuclease III [Geomonas sp. RF6]UFS71509.1 exodeoxyribonuclease III [Geomonas sp. RF6]